MDNREPNGTRSSDEIRQDIERTRAEMHDTVDQLEARLSPGQVLDEIWGRLRQNGGGAGDVVREHPVPLALMGLGVAWLAVERATADGTRSQHGYVGSTDRAEGRVGPYRGDDVDDIKFNDSDAGGSSNGLKAKASGAVDDAKDALSGVASKAGERTSQLKESAGERMDGMREQASELRGQAGEKARRAAGGIDRIIHDQPLIAGAITFGLGLAAGLAVPATRYENEHFGEKADALKETARERASQARDTTKRVATEAKSAVTEVAREAMDDPELKESLAAKAKTVVSQTTDALAGIAEKEGVDTSRIKRDRSTAGNAGGTEVH